ncbi:MAG: hypothetical protein LUG50_12335 [Planctomycetaceae bacterium]|nr:hypothetical protein [Planctomycetaceae bacterium]
MNPIKYLAAMAFALILGFSTLAPAVDAVTTPLTPAERAAVAATPGAGVTTTTTGVTTPIAATNQATDVAATTDRLATGYTGDMTNTTYTTTTANSVARYLPWIIGIAVVLGILYWASRRSRTTYVPPADRTTNPRTGAPHTTGNYNNL